MADNDEYIQWLSNHCARVVIAAVDRDGDRAARLIQQVGIEHGDQGVYTLCCGLAAAIAVMGKFEPGGVHGFEVHQTGRGAIPPEQAGKGTEAAIAAMRFVMAHLNEDTETKMALFGATPVVTAAGLAKLAGAYGRKARSENRAGS